MSKTIPIFKTDEEAEKFIDTADLSEYDLSGFKLAGFEFEAKDTQINMRLPASLLRAVRETARARGIPYQRFIRQTLEHAVARSSPKAGKAT
jgi:predicted DNA binding CopG/RHH family protein